MGLYCMLDVMSMGFPEELTMDVEEDTLAVEVDYSAALEAFGETFYKVATELVPVDTGYLRSTIDWDTDGQYVVEVWADAEYAQYPEFGTWCQAAQPYFTPAVEEAFQIFSQLAQEAVDKAGEELQNELNSFLEEISESGFDFVQMMVDFFALLMAMVIYMIIESLLMPFRDMLGQNKSSMNTGMPDIEII